MATTTANVQLGTPGRERSEIRSTEAGRGLVWLKQGVEDFRQAPALSLLYGALFALVCAGLYALSTSAPWYTLALFTGLVVIGPFLATGLYAASRDMERGVAPSISASLRLIWRRRTYLALFTLMLTLVMAAWVRFSALVFAVQFSTLNPTVGAYLNTLTSADGWMALTFYASVGLLLALIVFTVSAVAIPLILDRDRDFISAMQTSYRTVVANPATMFTWAAMIVALTAVGIVTAFVGFLVIFPILGYATWHSYRDMVKQ